ncbi:hypothetical protein ACN28E_42410 [Archangium lansingense]|uniref:hypothetical protein n=1 Tax=Archangium lansingense TaxID=2995310 RepID=UPI003B801EAB
MVPSVPKTFAWMAPRVPEVLVPRRTMARFEPLMHRLPSLRDFSFECRLDAGASRVDFLGTVTPAWGGEELAQEADAPPPERSGPIWDGVRALCAEWAPKQGPLHAAVPCIWLEFDHDRPAPHEPLPFTTVCVQPDYAHRRLVRGALPRAHPIRQTVWRSLELLGQGPLEPAVRRALARCFEEIPAGAALLHVAPTYARGTRTFRLVLTTPSRKVGAYLSRIGWPGRRTDVKRMLEPFQATSEVELYLDVADSVLPSVGIGCGLLAPDEPRIPFLFSRLIEWGICTPEKREAVVAWLGEEKRVLLPGLRNPSQLLRWATMKLVHRPGKPLEAKAYPEFHVRPVYFD